MPSEINPSQLLEKLIQALEAVNSTGKLTYLIKLLQANERKTVSAAEIFVLIFACAWCDREIRKHSQPFEQLWQTCYTSQPPEIMCPQILEVLNRRQDKELLNKELNDYFIEFMFSEYTLKAEKTPTHRTRKRP